MADDHDVIHFLTTSLHPPGQLPTDGYKVSVEDQVKLSQEYQDYQKKLEQQKEEYHRYYYKFIFKKFVLVAAIVILFCIYKEI